MLSQGPLASRQPQTTAVLRPFTLTSFHHSQAAHRPLGYNLSLPFRSSNNLGVVAINKTQTVGKRSEPRQ